MSDISIKKLVYIIEHQGCEGISCHYKGYDRCPLFDTDCGARAGFPKLQEDITKAMEYHGITKADLVEHLIGK